MTSHPNLDRAQAILDATRRGDYAPAFDNFADDIVMGNGPGAGPWHKQCHRLCSGLIMFTHSPGTAS
jgi:hypothetical protein